MYLPWGAVAASAAPTTYYSSTFDYNANNARLNKVTGPGLPASGVVYTYLSDSNLLWKTDFRTGSSTTIAQSLRAYESGTNRLESVENKWVASTPSAYTASKYAYRHDTSGRRTDVTRTGTAFAASHFDLWGYNDRSELAESLRYLGSDPTVTTSPDPNHDRLYEYDSLGNRLSLSEGTTLEATYLLDGLNQQKAFQTTSPATMGQGFLYDADGNLSSTFVAGDVNGDGQVTLADSTLITGNYGATCSSHAGLTSAQFTRADVNGDCTLDSTDLAIVNTYLNQSNTPPLVQFNWDAENRLVSAGPPSAFPLGSGSPDPNDVVSEYRYDYLGRRVEKLVKTWNTSGTPAWVVQQRRFFIYDGWTMLLELDARDLTGGAGGTPDGNPDNVILKKHTWGLDLAGQSGGLNSLQGAGGIGGLLATLDTAGTSGTSDDRSYIHFYDGNGNVGQMLEVTGTSSNPNYGTLAAKYEYDAYGNNLLDPANTTQSGTYAATNTFRFSTKAFDAETGLSYYGYRYYSAAWGRWINRDPLNEAGGMNLYGFVANRPTGSVDPFGLWTDEGVGALADMKTDPAMRELIRKRAEEEAYRRQLEREAKKDAYDAWLHGLHQQADRIRNWCVCELRNSANQKASFLGAGVIASGIIGADVAKAAGMPPEAVDQYLGELPRYRDQGIANAAQGLQNSAIGTVDGVVATVTFGSAPSLPNPQWAKNLIVQHDPSYDASVGFAKFGGDALQVAVGAKAPAGRRGAGKGGPCGPPGPQTTVLGENMGDRVIPYADATGGRPLPWTATPDEWGRLSPREQWRLNDGMLRSRINAGDNFVYIGRDSMRNPIERSRFDLTGSELLRLSERGVPYSTVPHEEVYSVIGRP